MVYSDCCQQYLGQSGAFGGSEHAGKHRIFSSGPAAETQMERVALWLCGVVNFRFMVLGTSGTEGKENWVWEADTHTAFRQLYL